MKKVILVICIGIPSGFVLLFAISYLAHAEIHYEHWDRFNEYRAEKGIYPLMASDDTSVFDWSEIQHNAYWKNIFTNNKFVGTSYFSNDSSYTEPYHAFKYLAFDTHLFFWKNIYVGEIDVFINPVSPDTVLKMTRIYHSPYVEGGELFFNQLDTILPNDPKNHYENSINKMDEPNKTGNISKTEAEQILKDWNLK